MPDLPFELTMSCGLIFIGSLFGTLLFGIACAQTLYYFRRYPDDGLGIKMLVVFLLLLDAGRTVACLEYVWNNTITSHSNMVATQLLPRAFPAQYFLAGATMSTAQLFFIYTIFTVVNRKWFQYHLTIFMVRSIYQGRVTIQSLSERPECRWYPSL